MAFVPDAWVLLYLQFHRWCVSEPGLVNEVLTCYVL
jgi:hypothetical protein